jgi:adenylate kinase
MRLLIIGPQASGKGTQADFIAKRLAIPHLSSGDMFREEQRKKSALGTKVEGLIRKGLLVPDELTWKMVKAHLLEHKDGWVLDGFPRTAPQAQLLDIYSAPDKVLVLEVPDEACLERISGRRVCETCGKDYHVMYKPPKKEGICDLDSGKLLQRADDYPEAVRLRLGAYHEKTAPLIKHYDKKVVRVNGDQSIQKVWKEIGKKLGI